MALNRKEIDELLTKEEMIYIATVKRNGDLGLGDGRGKINHEIKASSSTPTNLW